LTDTLSTTICDAGVARKSRHGGPAADRSGNGQARLQLPQLRREDRPSHHPHRFGIANDKERPTRPQFHRLRPPYVADLANAGAKVEDVDYVMCTHLQFRYVFD
jgi:hypothetical protein